MAKKPFKLNKTVQNSNPKTLEKNGSKSSSFLKFFKKYQKIVLTFTLVLVLLVGGSLAYFQIEKNNRDNAGAGLNCPGGTINIDGNCYATTGKVTITNYFCPNGTAANAQNLCDGSQNILYRCDGRANEAYLLNGDWAGGNWLNLCTYNNLLSNFVVKACQYSYPLFDNGNGNEYTRADRFNAAYNYDPGYTNYPPGGFNGQSASGPAFCMNGQGCPSGMRAIFGEAPIRYGTSGNAYKTMQLLCVNINLIGQTGPSSPLFTIAGGRSGSYIGDRKCGDNPGGGTAPLSAFNGSYTIIGDQYGNDHKEVVWLCARTNFSATSSTTSQVCPASHPVEVNSTTCRASSPNNTGSSYTIDQAALANSVATCTPNPVTAKSTVACTFTLSGSPTGVYILPAVIPGNNNNTLSLVGAIVLPNSPKWPAAGWENNFTTSGTQCTISGSNLICPNIPTIDGQVPTGLPVIHYPWAALYYPKSGTITINPSYNPKGDDDGDGIPNDKECNATGANCPDTDGDTIPDYKDSDSDNDGILDKDERGTACASLTACTPVDTDGDGKPDFRDSDSDNDGVWDLI